MYPFIHIGPLTLGSYGLMVAIGLICAFFILRADFARRGVSADAEAIIGITGLAGLAGSRLYHLLESPAEFFRRSVAAAFQHDGFCVCRRDHRRIHRACAFGEALPDVAAADAGRRFSRGGDGLRHRAHRLPDFRRRRLRHSHVAALGHEFSEWHRAHDASGFHPTPIYEFLAAVLIFWILWRLGERCLKTHAPNGIIFAAYLVLTGIARFLVEIIRINPRSFYGLTNAQAASVVSILAGVALFVYCRKAAPQKIRA